VVRMNTVAYLDFDAGTEKVRLGVEQIWLAPKCRDRFLNDTVRAVQPHQALGAHRRMKRCPRHSCAVEQVDRGRRRLLKQLPRLVQLACPLKLPNLAHVPTPGPRLHRRAAVSEFRGRERRKAV
jgi:hypothetical protein